MGDDIATDAPPSTVDTVDGGAPPLRERALPWTTLADGRRDPKDRAVVSTSRVLLQVGLVAALVIGLVVSGGVVVARRTAEREAINGAVLAADLMATGVVEPALSDNLLSASPKAALQAQASLDAVVKKLVKSTSVFRIKLWTPEGRIVYSDEKRLINRSYQMAADHREALVDPQTVAEVSELKGPENEFERGQGKLLEVYRPVWLPNGEPLLFETYTKYSTVDSRTSQLWKGFAGLMVSTLLLLVVLLLPLLWALLDRLRRGQRQREALLQHAVDASSQERQRIAGTLHDGVVQELAAISFAVSAAAEQADSKGQPQLAERLRSAATTVRASIGGLRSLLVDIYPPSLSSAGLVTALHDLTATLRSRSVDVRLDLPPVDQPTGLDAAGEQLVFRVAQECMRNASRHSAAQTVNLRLFTRKDMVILEVIDDGVGFEMDHALRSSNKGHFGLRLLPDLATQAGATLRLATAPGAGTRWRLEMPTT
ncbi:histidine kinase [Flavobacterium sp.]|uniref:sensor histidine kinase n=1 Tax=Flavobacterium sp. TaxID=239 RepID=UPI0032647EA3